MKGTLYTEETASLVELFTSQRRQLVQYLIRIVKCDETAADIAQESYLILSQTSGRETIQHPRGLLYRIAANLAFNHLRHQKVVDQKRPLFEVAEDESNLIPSAEHQASQQQRLDQFVRIVEALPPRCREVFILHKVQGLSLKEVAVEMGISVKVVEKQVTKGLKLCRQQMTD